LQKGKISLKIGKKKRKYRVFLIHWKGGRGGGGIFHFLKVWQEGVPPSFFMQEGRKEGTRSTQYQEREAAAERGKAKKNLAYRQVNGFPFPGEERSTPGLWGKKGKEKFEEGGGGK